jgi:glucose-1-phosphate cytidylyltransferase
LRFAAEHADTEEVYALNGDELLDVDLDALLALHRTTRVEATITVARPHSPYGIVELGAGALVRGFAEAARAPHWVNCGVYVLRREALARFPLTGDHETSTFPALAARSALAAYRHDGAWLTVNTPKDLSQAEAYVLSHPGWPVYTAGSAR